MTRQEQNKILDDKIESNNNQYKIDRLNAEISAFSSGDLNKYEFLTRKDLNYKPNGLERAKFEFSPSDRAFNEGLDKTVPNYQEEGVIKLSKEIRDNLAGGINIPAGLILPLGPPGLPGLPGPQGPQVPQGPQGPIPPAPQRPIVTTVPRTTIRTPNVSTVTAVPNIPIVTTVPRATIRTPNVSTVTSVPNIPIVTTVPRTTIRTPNVPTVTAVLNVPIVTTVSDIQTSIIAPIITPILSRAPLPDLIKTRKKTKKSSKILDNVIDVLDATIENINKPSEQWGNPPPASVSGDRFNILVQEDEIKNIYDNIKLLENKLKNNNSTLAKYKKISDDIDQMKKKMYLKKIKNYMRLKKNRKKN